LVDRTAICDWQTVIAGRRHRAPVVMLSPMSGLWWGCAEKACFGQPSSSLLDGIE